MNGRWALTLPETAAGALGPLRLVPGLEVCPQGGLIWLRGSGADAALELQLRQLPGAIHYDLIENHALRLRGARVPRGQLPSGTWMPIAEWMSVRWPRAVEGGMAPQPMALHLVRSLSPQRTNLLRLTLSSWSDYARQAPLIRLQQWRFAVTVDDVVWVHACSKQPLPSVPGEQFVEHQGIAVPAGWTWSPAVETAIVREVLALEEQEWGIFSAVGDGHWERLSEQDFVGASRMAVRLAVSREER